MTRVFVLDNYDSFTFNLVQYLGELGADVTVERNDRIDGDRLSVLAPDAVVISPGPGTPADAGASIAVVGWCAANGVPLLGVCLGHQAVAEAFGARIVRAPAVVHGKTSEITHDGRGVFADVSSPFAAMRYHSLVVDPSSVRTPLEVSAWTSDGVVMGIRHTALPIEGVQFHPESVLTEHGMRLLGNVLCVVARGSRTGTASA